MKVARLCRFAVGSGQPVPGWSAGNLLMVEAGGQHIHSFRCGLDYAFIRDAQ